MAVLDTNIIIEIESENQKLEAALKKIIGQSTEKAYITSPTYSEFFYGVVDKPEPKQHKALEFLDKFALLNTSKNSSRVLANIKHKLEKAGKMIPIFDLFIASIVMDNGATLVTWDEYLKNSEGKKVIIIDQD